MNDKFHKNYRNELMRIKNLGQIDFIEIIYEQNYPLYYLPNFPSRYC